MCSSPGWPLSRSGASQAGQDLLFGRSWGSCPHPVVFPRVQAEQGEPTSTASSTFSLPAASCLPWLHLLVSGETRLFVSRLYLYLALKLTKCTSGAALACALRPRGSPSVPEALRATVLFSDLPLKLFLLPSLPTNCPVSLSPPTTWIVASVL